MEDKNGIEIIAEERRRQIEEEGFHPTEDVILYRDDELAKAASVYAAPESVPFNVWPWNKSWLKLSPQNRIKDLAKAGALIAAQIDVLLKLNK